MVELKHADAFELAEQLNALLSEPASKPPSPGRNKASRVNQSTSWPTEEPVPIRRAKCRDRDLPWQRGGRGNEEYTPVPLIGKARIVPISRQNALAVWPPPQRGPPGSITFFDRPGRQVELSVVIAEVELNDELNLGLRMSATGLAIENGDNALAWREHHQPCHQGVRCLRFV